MKAQGPRRGAVQEGIVVRDTGAGTVQKAAVLLPEAVRQPGDLPLHKPLAPGARQALALRADPNITPSLPDGRLDGVAYARAVLAEIRRIKEKEPHRRCVVIFDLDNTLFETRARTRAVLKAFDPITFANLPLEKIGWNAEETCHNLQRPELAAAAQAHWAEAFWDGANFGHDLLMEVMAELAQEAASAKAEIFYLSGRIEDLREASRAQLLAAELPLASEAHLVLKPSMEVRTSPFKAEWLLELEASGAFIGWFATDSHKEIREIGAHEQAAQGDADLPLLLVEHPLTRPAPDDGRTPVFPGPAARLRDLRDQGKSAAPKSTLQ
ncbi:MAG: hypothetical protein IPG45_05840 [Deltaproteobacteria bacterium]|nr:hypothetical protein [Deltaproteobacteria bacterium]